MDPSVPSEGHDGGDGPEAQTARVGARAAGQGRAAARGRTSSPTPAASRPHPAGRDHRRRMPAWRSARRPRASHYRVAGRVMSRREHGKAAFFTLRDGWDDLQVYGNVDTLGEESFERLTDLDLGDIIGCEGHVFRTRRGELTVFAESWTLLTKSLRPLPEKWHGLQDRETRYRQRYVDLIANPEVAWQLRGRGQAGLGHAPLPGGPGLRGGRDPHPAAPARGRSGPALRHPSQRARHRPLPAHRSRALPQAAAGGRIRPHLRDRQELPQRGHLAGAQSRVHHDGALLGVRGLQRHHGAGGEHDPGAGPGGRGRAPRSWWARTASS